MSSFLDRVRNRPIPVDLFKAAVLAISDLPQESRQTMEGRANCIIRLLQEFGVKARNASDLLTGISFRLEALVRLTDEPEYRAWSVKTDTPGMDYISEDLVEAAAIEPLVCDDTCARFDPHSFFKRVLEISEASRS
jgi:hypothetical protein